MGSLRPLRCSVPFLSSHVSPMMNAAMINADRTARSAVLPDERTLDPRRCHGNPAIGCKAQDAPFPSAELDKVLGPNMQHSPNQAGRRNLMVPLCVRGGVDDGPTMPRELAAESLSVSSRVLEPGPRSSGATRVDDHILYPATQDGRARDVC